MATSIFIIFFLFSLTFHPTAAQNCNSQTFSNNRNYASCNQLSALGATIHYTYSPSNRTLDVAFRCAQSQDGWVAWALNPTPGTNRMIGAQTLFAFKHSNGSLVVYRTPMSNTSPQVSDSGLSFPVYSRAAEYLDGAFTIYASVGLPQNRTSFLQVWQSSTTMSGGLPAGHLFSGQNVQSYGQVDFASGVSSGAGSNSRLRRKNIHGILNAIGWGVLLPIGVITARYMKVFADPAWFYLHVACQLSGYIIGVAGWGLGLKLGSESVGITYHSHRNIGIALFTLATLQIFALLLRPNKDHKYRIYWNVYHHGVGYGVIILSVINMFKGFDILDPAKGWKHAYIGIIASLAGLALLLEAITWPIVLKRRKGAEDKSHHAQNGINGTNGYGRQLHGV